MKDVVTSPHRLTHWCLAVALLMVGCGDENRQGPSPQVTLLPPSDYGVMIFADDEDSRIAGFRGLAAHGPKAAEALPALIQALQERDSKMRHSAAQVIGRIGETAVHPLSERLNKTSDPVEMAGICEALGEIGPAAAPAIKEIIGASTDYYPEVRTEAALALGKIRKNIGTGTIERSLSIQNEDTTKVARMVLGSEVGASLTGVEARISHQEAEAGEIRRSLNHFGISNPEGLLGKLPDEEADSLEFSIAIGGRGDSANDVVPVLVDLLIDDESEMVRSAAARALGTIGPGAAKGTKALAEGLFDWERSVRLRCAWALGQIGPSATNALGELESRSMTDDVEFAQLINQSIDRIKEK